MESFSAGRILGDFLQKMAHRTGRLPAQLLSCTLLLNILAASTMAIMGGKNPSKEPLRHQVCAL